MTQQNTMPAVLYLGVTHDHKDCLSCEAYYSSSYIDGFEGPTGKYIRADLHTDLLKQAYKQIDILSNLITVDNLTQQMMFKNAQKVMKQIDKALGETK